MAEWIYANPNPRRRITGDCVVRAVSLATGQSWEDTFTMVALTALAMHDMPNSNKVWQMYLKSLGLRRREVPDTCPDCYTVGDFADDHPKGTFVVGTGTHAVCVIDGKCYDTWDSRPESIEFYYYKEGEQDA